MWYLQRFESASWLAWSQLFKPAAFDLPKPWQISTVSNLDYACLGSSISFYTPDSCPSPVANGVGWGGDGMRTFLEHAHILDATQLAASCYATDGGVGLGLYIWDEKCQVSFIPTRPPTTYVNSRLADFW